MCSLYRNPFTPEKPDSLFLIPWLEKRKLVRKKAHKFRSREMRYLRMLRGSSHLPTSMQKNIFYLAGVPDSLLAQGRKRNTISQDRYCSWRHLVNISMV